ncbi:MAG TPA: DUF5312 family protein [Magnetospirillaceae bacterium]|nr:DUF5312 family protein [Magnetospirillaceae bacterium]
MATKSPASSGAETQPAGGLFQRFLEIFSGGGPEAEKRKLLRSIGKELSRSRYRFYRPKGSEALPGIGRFFYEIYKIVAPAQILLTNATGSGVLRSFVIESFLNKEQKEYWERLTDGWIQEKAKTLPIKELSELVKQNMIRFFSLFDSDLTTRIDAAHSTLVALANFVNFDYYFLLRKFDSSLPERSFSHNPKFEAISADYIADDLKDFLEVFLALNLDADWKRILGALREYRNIDVLPIDSWVRLVGSLGEVRSSHVLEQIVRHAQKDPYWTATARTTSERIVEPFLERLRNQMEILLQKIHQERRASKIDQLAKQIFGTTVVVRMRNYTEKANEIFAKKTVGGFTHTAALSYLRAFLNDFFKKDVRELVDLVIIRGQWTSNILSQQLSDAYHALLELSDEIIKFDEALADDGDLGIKLRNILARSDRDKEHMKYLRNILKDTNDKASGLVNRSALNLIAVGKHLKNLIEDLSKTHPDLLLNWKEIENSAARPLRDWMLAAYRNIYHLVQLLQFFVVKDG